MEEKIKRMFSKSKGKDDFDYLNNFEVNFKNQLENINIFNFFIYFLIFQEIPKVLIITLNQACKTKQVKVL